jgi:hypothetical protein
MKNIYSKNIGGAFEKAAPDRQGRIPTRLNRVLSGSFRIVVLARCLPACVLRTENLSEIFAFQVEEFWGGVTVHPARQKPQAI